MPHNATEVSHSVGYSEWFQQTFNASYAPFAVEITQPQTGLNTTSRYYKQYTGLEYNVKVYVRGGDFSALQYSLTTAPNGMSINPNTGVITWPNPIEAGSPHNITVQVTDGNTSDTVSWTLTVDTTNAVFVDSVTGNAANDGSIGSPLSDITDWYGASKSDSTYAEHFVYYRTGTYNIDCIPKNDPTGGVTLSVNKPRVHMAYPGESPVLNAGTGHWFTDSQTSDQYFEGFTIQNVGAYPNIVGEGVWFSRLAGLRHVYRKNNFASVEQSTGNNNQSYIMAPFGDCSNWGISENTFDATGETIYAMGVFYNTEKAVIESNRVLNCTGIGIGMKTNNGTQSIRGNWVSGSGVLYEVIGFASDTGTGNAELSWNYADGTVTPFRVNYGRVGADLPFYFIRNTTRAPFNVREWIEADSDASLYFIDNVVVGGSSYVSEFTVDQTRYDETGTLLNATEANYLDQATGLLIDTYESQNATKGHGGYAGLK